MTSNDRRSAVNQDTCQNCGSSLGNGEDHPPATYCWQCPPWQCEDCGDWLTVENLCRCWTGVEGMPLADLKALFAKGGLSIGGFQ